MCWYLISSSATTKTSSWTSSSSSASPFCPLCFLPLPPFTSLLPFSSLFIFSLDFFLRLCVSPLHIWSGFQEQLSRGILSKRGHSRAPFFSCALSFIRTHLKKNSSQKLTHYPVVPSFWLHYCFLFDFYSCSCPSSLPVSLNEHVCAEGHFTDLHE